ncbi:MAG TPA: UvrD-helicase domain-containing protein, partial [Gemmataceae bacterium]|nr:UvrD-helicase domain-containing protein [Gemmataceae bacterium]
MGAASAGDFLNDQQQRAVFGREASIVLSSGAGCGKTHVLTQRYLSHLDRGEADVGQIVAITFTERAARQMRERIRQSLSHRLKGADTDDEATRWDQYLRDLETAPISTIHAFCLLLLQQHAVEAGLDPHFTVLEDVLSTNLEAEALTDCLQRLLTSEAQAGEDLRELVLCYGWKPTTEAVRALVNSGDRRDWPNWCRLPAEEIAADWQAFAREDLLPRYVVHVVRSAPKVARCLEFLRRTQPRPGSKMAENVRRLLEQVPRLAQAADLAAAVEELTELAKVGGERGKAWASDEEYEVVKEVFKGFRDDLPGRMQLFLTTTDDLPQAALMAQRFLRVAAEAAHTYHLLKHRNGVVDFQDLLVQARDLLRDHPQVRERLQRRYRFLLIDELQDTDPVQMELVGHLCGAELTQGKLFAVGDHKQSIYRFRGADVHRFQQLRQGVPHEGRLGLTINYRSQPAVLHFANALLCRHLDDYEPLVAHHPQVNPGPCVEFLWSPRGDKEAVAEARTREAEWIAARISAMVHGHEALVVDREHGGDSLRPVCQGDVALLFRSMSNVPLYEAALRKHGLDYYLVGGWAFFAQQEIYDLLNLLRALENPQDGLSLAGALRSPFCCLSDEALFLLARHGHGLWAGLHDPALRQRLPADQAEGAARAVRYLDRWRGLKDRLPIARLLGEVFADSGFDAATQFEFLGDRKLANLWKMMDLARTFDRSGLFGLAEFIERLGDLVRTQPREEQAATQPENADVVRLMTIHQAKGLEFPVVFVPDVAAVGGGWHLPPARWHDRLGCVPRPPAEDPPPFPDFAWRLWEAAEAIEDWREELRTLYVACTRAQDYLVLSAAIPKPFQPGNAWMTTLTERFDIATGACLDPDIPAGQLPSVRVMEAASSGRWAARGGQSSEQTKKANRRQAEGGDEALSMATAIAPVPLRLTGSEVLPVRVLELRPVGADSGRDLPTSEDVAAQFDAEDGSDRTSWVPPCRRTEAPYDGEQAARDRVIRVVLERWDFEDADGWRPLLAKASAGSPHAPIDLEPLFVGFARSETCRLLASARCSHRDVEF